MKLSADEQKAAKTKILREFADGNNVRATLDKITDEIFDTTTALWDWQIYRDVEQIFNSLRSAGKIETRVENSILRGYVTEVGQTQQLEQDLTKTLNLLDGRISARLHNALVDELTVARLALE